MRRWPVVCLIDPVGDVYACPFVLHDEFLAVPCATRRLPKVWQESDLFTELREPQSAGACGLATSMRARAAVAASSSRASRSTARPGMCARSWRGGDGFRRPCRREQVQPHHRVQPDPSAEAPPLKADRRPVRPQP